MEYTVSEFSKLSGVSARTLRYYDQIGLLEPKRVDQNGYRIYGQKQVDLLQQILFFRELGIGLNEIRKIVFAPDFDREKALTSHLSDLEKRKTHIEKIIMNVSQTIRTLRGELHMTDKEKFDGFKQRLIDENEQKYGVEIREKYGENTVNLSNQRVKAMTQEQYGSAERLASEIIEILKAAFAEGNPAGALAQRACDLHKQWICLYWPEEMYSKEAHLGLGKMYCEDERFKEYYDGIAPGCTEFFSNAIRIYCN